MDSLIRDQLAKANPCDGPHSKVEAENIDVKEKWDQFVMGSLVGESNAEKGQNIDEYASEKWPFAAKIVDCKPNEECEKDIQKSQKNWIKAVKGVVFLSCLWIDRRQLKHLRRIEEDAVYSH